MAAVTSYNSNQCRPISLSLFWLRGTAAPRNQCCPIMTLIGLRIRFSYHASTLFHEVIAEKHY